ncbi:hypothetical protein niasHS_009227 [Heterodera schachtii]|uniref:Lon proteolytic domain-containing protein n=1 Tax=Heterodera schachtii TaxID=97005 RepID=A0ABD2IYP6_HETSC
MARSGSDGGLMYFEVAKADPFNSRSERGTCFYTGECIRRRKNTYAQGKNTYLVKARIHMNVVSMAGYNKSGPSGGLAGGMAFISLARGAKSKLRNTGQLALYGALVPVGSIPEKKKAACDAHMQYLGAARREPTEL